MHAGCFFLPECSFHWTVSNDLLLCVLFSDDALGSRYHIGCMEIIYFFKIRLHQDNKTDKTLSIFMGLITYFDSYFNHRFSLMSTEFQK